MDSDWSRVLPRRLGSIGDGRSRASASSLPPGTHLRCRRDPRTTQQCLCTWCGLHNRGRLELSGVLRPSPRAGGCDHDLVFSTYRPGPAPRNYDGAHWRNRPSYSPHRLPHGALPPDDRHKKMVEVHCRWRVGARVFRFDCRYRPPALGFKISVLHVAVFLPVFLPGSGCDGHLMTHSDECRLRSAMRRRLTGTQRLFANKE
jgi:hypothetical protein